MSTTMHLSSISHHPVDAVRTARFEVPDAAARSARAARFEATDAAARSARADAPSPLAGDARPGDVLALVGGSVVQDANHNGFVDGADDVVRSDGLPWPGRHIDVRG